MPRAVLLAAAICAAAPARADDPKAVVLEVGKKIDVCTQKLVPCPASTFSCDPSHVARFESVDEGIELKGVAPGTTTCTVRGFAGAFLRVLVVTVNAAPGAESPAR